LGTRYTHENANGRKVSIGVAGYGEGGLLALYTAALDPRIETTHAREGWREAAAWLAAGLFVI